MHPKGPDATAVPASLKKGGIDQISKEIPAAAKAGVASLKSGSGK